MHCMTRISQQECRGILELREYTFSLGIEARVRRRIIMNISFSIAAVHLRTLLLQRLNQATISLW
jgi:hypothetical protein